jgi:GNAT superfamily N-acetyltransferase
MLKSMVKGLFKDSRFYNDPFFTRGEAEKFYWTWIENLVCDKKVKTFLVEGGGFITCKKVSKNKGSIPLIGVIPRRQNKGIGQSLIYEALEWLKKAGVKSVNVRTQANNVDAMNFYSGLGFRIKYADMTMGMILNGER